MLFSHKHAIASLRKSNYPEIVWMLPIRTTYKRFLTIWLVFSVALLPGRYELKASFYHLSLHAVFTTTLMSGGLALQIHSNLLPMCPPVRQRLDSEKPHLRDLLAAGFSFSFVPLITSTGMVAGRSRELEDMLLCAALSAGWDWGGSARFFGACFLSLTVPDSADLLLRLAFWSWQWWFSLRASKWHLDFPHKLEVSHQKAISPLEVQCVVFKVVLES